MKNKVSSAWMLAIAFCLMGAAHASPASADEEAVAQALKDAAGKKDVSWLESAVLLKEAGTWRIQFFHSTRVPAK